MQGHIDEQKNTRKNEQQRKGHPDIDNAPNLADRDE
jgi:hypothetical protein